MRPHGQITLSILTLALVGSALGAVSPANAQAGNRLPAPAGTSIVSPAVRTAIAPTPGISGPHDPGPTPTPTPPGSPSGPDLKIEFAGYVDGNTLAVAVTNVGVAATSPATARVEKVSPPSAAGGAREFRVPALQPNQSFNVTYGIGVGPCPAGLAVRATVSSDTDVNSSNNTTTQTVCGNSNVLAQHGQPELLPGPHTLDISPDYYTASWTHIDGCMTSAHPLAPGATTLAGWSQQRCTDMDVDARGDIQYIQKNDSWALQSGVHFDFSQLDQIPAKTVTSAVLTFDEARFRWTGANGDDRDVPGCIAAVGLPTTDWLAVPNGSLIPNITVTDFSPWPSDRQDFSGTAFDVTGPVQSMLQQPRNSDQRFAVMPQGGQQIFPNSFVLRGADEGLHGDDESSCVSALSNAKLHVTFSVPEQP
jgi:hypothetical protein